MKSESKSQSWTALTASLDTEPTAQCMVPGGLPSCRPVILSTLSSGPEQVVPGPALLSATRSFSRGKILGFAGSSLYFFIYFCSVTVIPLFSPLLTTVPSPAMPAVNPPHIVRAHESSGFSLWKSFPCEFFPQWNLTVLVAMKTLSHHILLGLAGYCKHFKAGILLLSLL